MKMRCNNNILRRRSKIFHPVFTHTLWPRTICIPFPYRSRTLPSYLFFPFARRTRPGHCVFRFHILWCTQSVIYYFIVIIVMTYTARYDNVFARYAHLHSDFINFYIFTKKKCTTQEVLLWWYKHVFFKWDPHFCLLNWKLF